MLWYKSFEEMPQIHHPNISKSFFPPGKDENFHLERCMRIFPHLQDTGGFFVAVLEKTKEFDRSVSDTATTASATSSSSSTSSTSSILPEKEKKPQQQQEHEQDEEEALEQEKEKIKENLKSKKKEKSRRTFFASF